jgi:hypothetical protein
VHQRDTNSRVSRGHICRIVGSCVGDAYGSRVMQTNVRRLHEHAGANVAKQIVPPPRSRKWRLNVIEHPGWVGGALVAVSVCDSPAISCDRARLRLGSPCSRTYENTQPRGVRVCGA